MTLANFSYCFAVTCVACVDILYHIVAHSEPRRSACNAFFCRVGLFCKNERSPLDTQRGRHS